MASDMLGPEPGGPGVGQKKRIGRKREVSRQARRVVQRSKRFLFIKKNEEVTQIGNARIEGKNVINTTYPNPFLPHAKKALFGRLTSFPPVSSPPFPLLPR